MTIEDRVKEVFDQIATLDDDVNRSTTIESLNLDSLDVTELVMELEEEFDITIGDNDAESWTTFGDVIDHIEEKS